MELEKLWYVANAYSGHEDKVAEKIETRAESTGMQDFIFRTIVPENTEVVTNSKGEKKEKAVKMFPGYILVEMIMTDESWSVIRNTPGVTGFIGSSGKGAKPTALNVDEVDRILSNMGLTRDEESLVVGDHVCIINGPFTDMTGKIETIDLENSSATILIDLFGQETIVEAELFQISKV